METYIIILLVLLFAADLLTLAVRGGGFIQTPAGLILLPNLPVSTVIGTLNTC
jgi:uncharacterized membrane protein YfcA